VLYSGPFHELSHFKGKRLPTTIPVQPHLEFDPLRQSHFSTRLHFAVFLFGSPSINYRSHRTKLAMSDEENALGHPKLQPKSPVPSDIEISHDICRAGLLDMAEVAKQYV
jgi:hypothetical protein